MPSSSSSIPSLAEGECLKILIRLQISSISVGNSSREFAFAESKDEKDSYSLSICLEGEGRFSTSKEMPISSSCRHIEINETISLVRYNLMFNMIIKLKNRRGFQCSKSLSHFLPVALIK